jgi:hypothetical protein
VNWPKQGRSGAKDLAYERDSYLPSKTLRAEMGFTFRHAGCVNRVENVETKATPSKSTGRRAVRQRPKKSLPA